MLAFVGVLVIGGGAGPGGAAVLYPRFRRAALKGAAHASYFAVLNLLAFHLGVDLTQRNVNHETVRRDMMGIPNAQAPNS